MKRANLINKLEKEGYPVNYGRISYFDNVPYITTKEGTKVFLTNFYYNNSNISIGYDANLITYNLVKEAIDHAEGNYKNYLLDINESYTPFVTDSKKITKSWEN